MKQYPNMSVLLILVVLSLLHHGLVSSNSDIAPVALTVDASPEKQRKIPDTLFGIFFEVCQISRCKIFYYCIF